MIRPQGEPFLNIKSTADAVFVLTPPLANPKIGRFFYQGALP
jgi:hypothetical protein